MVKDILRFRFGFPRKIVFEAGAVNIVGKLIREMGIRGKAMLVTGRRFARESGYLNKILRSLKENGIDAVIFDRVEPNPSTATVERGAEIAKENSINMIVAFGGGSAMDAGKAIAVLASHGGRAEDYFYPAVIEPPIYPIIAVPTTCGTGSEVTKYAVISKGIRKNTIVGEQIIPTLSILDPEVLRFLPKDLLAYTAMDAISHAIESYFNKNHTLISDIYAVESLKVIFKNFKSACDGAPEAREKLFFGSMLAGMAINVCGTVVVHGLGYYLTMRYGLHHGLANALFLSQFMKYVSNIMPERMLKLGRELGLSPASAQDSSQLLMEKLEELKSYSGIPRSLKESGVPESDLERVIEEALSYRRNLENLPEIPTREELSKIVKDAFYGQDVS